jgi:tRNA_anti-like
MNSFLSAILKIIIIGLIAFPIFFIFVVSSNSDKEEDTKKLLIERAKKDKNLAISATPSQISDLYDANEFAVDEKYKGKLVSISGNVKNLTTVLSTPVLEIDAEGSGLVAAIVQKRLYMDFNGDDAALRSLFAKISVGTKIRLLCFGSGGVHFKCYSNSVY